GLRVFALGDPRRCRALTALVLLGPATPLLFMGQEFAASSPFLYFADHEPELAALVRAGRARFLAQFESLAEAAMQAQLDDPGAPATFERSKLDLSERARPPHAAVLALHRDLIELRRSDPVFRAQAAHGMDGAVLGPGALALRFYAPDRRDRLVLVNLGTDLPLVSQAEPLLAPPAGTMWGLLWSSEDPRYGGTGTPALARSGLLAPGGAALVLGP
ncbi:MAG TPA: DUF3459 domain-containing protein, partial [Gemmatimonadales bacterium]|nr:DUF3459 domain-containing protein [Gemmatimonadales bacterium]